MEKGYLNTPLGPLEIHTTEEGLQAVTFIEAPQVGISSSHPLITESIRQLADYFEGKIKEFTLPLHPQGTAFQQSVWNELQKIAFGKHCSYLDIATRLNNKGSIRAVGAANGRNPIAIIIPCHRVIGSDGSLTGYAGGLWRKQWLLEHEGISKTTQTSLSF